MDWLFQLLSVVIAFGPIVVGIALWHFVWNRDSGSSSNPPPPPPNGPERKPVPPSPRFSCDRSPVVHRKPTFAHAQRTRHRF